LKKQVSVAAAAALLLSPLMVGSASAHDESESGNGGLEVELRPAIVDVGQLVVVEAEFELEDDEDESDGTDSSVEDGTDGSVEDGTDGSVEDGSDGTDGSVDAQEDDTSGGAPLVVDFVVDFGDGSEPVAMVPEDDEDDDEAEAEATHVYDADGEYTVTVTATPSGGSPVQTSVVVKVGSGASRLAGDDRHGTAERLSRENFPTDGSAKAVLLARSDGFADALASASMAVLEDAPVLLTAAADLPPSVLEEIQRALAPDGTVYVLGGEGAIASTVVDSLTAAGYQVVRIAGSDRLDTAVQIANFLVDSGVEIDEVVVANGSTFPDALSGAAFAAAFDAPVLLTGSDALDPRVEDFLARIGADAEVFVTGGVAAVSDAVVAEIAALGLEVTRLAGDDRFETSAEVAETLFPLATSVVLATGHNFPDALAGAAHAGRLDAPVLLVGDTLPDPVREYLTERAGQITRLYVLGGDAAVSDAVLAEVKAILGL
jgi:putative cell wall-binding protein